jgi:hypothetical protein
LITKGSSLSFWREIRKHRRRQTGVKVTGNRRDGRRRDSASISRALTLLQGPTALLRQASHRELEEWSSLAIKKDLSSLTGERNHRTQSEMRTADDADFAQSGSSMEDAKPEHNKLNH